MKASPRITMRDIARKLGIDQSTVSLALRDHPRISVGLRDKIKRAANELGYIPDPMLRALAQYRQTARVQPIVSELAWINRWTPSESLFKHAEFVGYWRGATAAARLNGFSLEPFAVGKMSLQRLRGILRARNITGVIIPPHGPSANNDWTGMDFSDFCVVRLGYSVALSAHAVGAEQVGAGILGFKKIHAYGYRRIGFISDTAAEASSRFQAGFLFAQENTHDSVRLPTLLLTDRGDSKDRESLRLWLKEHRPDAIFTTNPRVQTLLSEAGFRVPQDIALAGTSILDGNVTTGIDQRPEEIGKCAVETLISLINHNHKGVPEMPRIVTVSSTWVDGPGLPPKQNPF